IEYLKEKLKGLEMTKEEEEIIECIEEKDAIMNEQVKLYLCDKFDGSIPISELPYDNWLKASSIKKRNYVDSKKDEETKLCRDFKCTLKAGKAQLKLDFIDPGKQVPKGSGSDNWRGDQSNKEGNYATSMINAARVSKRGCSNTSQNANEGPPFDTNIDTPMLENSKIQQVTIYSQLDKAIQNLSQLEGTCTHNALSYH
ncbi:Eukaryotic translation initiation factor 3 subunit G, partial [Bienertia sinuspersici]